MTRASASLTRDAHGAALLALAMHAVAAVCLLLVLRSGLAPPSAAARAAFVGDHAGLWRLAWLTWSAAAIAILLMSVALSRFLTVEGAGRIALLAPWLTAAAVAADLGGQMVAMALLPDAAHAGDLARFHALERTVALLSGGLGNGLYTAAVALLSWCARRRLPRWVGIAAIAVTLAGAALTLSAAADFAAGAAASSAALVPALLAWLWGVVHATRMRA